MDKIRLTRCRPSGEMEWKGTWEMPVLLVAEKVLEHFPSISSDDPPLKGKRAFWTIRYSVNTRTCQRLGQCQGNPNRKR